MELSWLRTFIVASQTRNFRKASEQLYISQPSVSVHIKQLEKEMGVALFERSNKKVALTEAGRYFVGEAKEMVRVHEDGLKKMRSFMQGYTAALKIAISPLIADTILPAVLKRFMNEYPYVEVDVKIIESNDIERAVMNEEVDIGLSCLPSLHKEVGSEKLYSDRVMLVAPHDGRDFESALPLDEEEVLHHARILTHNHPGYWEELCEILKHFYPNSKMMKVSQIHITKRFITEGLGVSFLPSSTVRRELLEGRLMEIPVHSFELPEANAYSLWKYPHETQQQFLQFLSRFHY